MTSRHPAPRPAGGSPRADRRPAGKADAGGRGCLKTKTAVDVFVSVMLKFFGFTSSSKSPGLIIVRIIPRSPYVLFDLRCGGNGPARSHPRSEQKLSMPMRAPKVNLGVGVYFDDNGKIPLLAAVKAAEDARLKAALPVAIQPIEGRRLQQSPCRTCCSARLPPDRRRPCHHRPGLGGTGALKIGADYLKRLNPAAKVTSQRPVLGKPPRPVRKRRFLSSTVTLLRRHHPWRRLRRHEGLPTDGWMPARSSSCTPAATIRPAPT